MTSPERLADHLDPATVRRLASRLRGELVRPGDPDYDRGRRVWNRAVDRYPTLIVRPLGVDDVVAAVDFARVHQMTLAVRGGGHSPAGHGTVDGGLVVDLSAMTGLDIDPVERVARADAGLTWGTYNARAHEHGLATPGGDVASVGLAGLTLGGGMGWLMRKHGMTIDNLSSVDVVTADGASLTASEADHPDLFWALRGGGGNFGIATSFRYRLHPVTTVLGGALVYTATHDVLRAYGAVTTEAADELATISFVGLAPPLPFIPPEVHGTPVHLIIPCYSGDLDEGQRALAPLRSLGGRTPIADTTGPVPYPALYDLTATAATSRPHAVRNAFLRDLSDETIEIVLAFVDRATSPFGVIAIRELGGAMARVPVDATAFAHRDKAFYLAADNAWAEDDPSPERHVEWTESFWRAAAPHTDGAYASYLEAGGVDRIASAYSVPTQRRLAEIKRRYDPDNVFRVNPNIEPA